MYFIIYKKDNIEKLTLPDSTTWEELLSKIQGTVIEIFQSNILECKNFDEYVAATYHKVNNARKAR